jgi:CRISPR-associated protein Csb1
MTEASINQFDSWLTDGGPAALVLREALMPVEGHEGVVFPATFAASEDKTFKGGYNIDSYPDNTNICLIDSVGSQANRMEPLFAKDDYKALVPQVIVNAGDKRVNLLDAGHRAGDAIVRCSELQEALQKAFKDLQSGNAGPLAKIAPTSLVFGVWDSRDTQTKVPRLIASTIRAYNVQVLTRSAQYNPATSYVDSNLLDDPSDNRKLKDAYSERGFIHVPASAAPGGVVAKGGIRREATLHLAALRLLKAQEAQGSNERAETLPLRRYILGLALTAFAHSSETYLRQGCNLVLDPEKKREIKLVFADGRREDFNLDTVKAFAVAAAKAFGVGEDREVQFDKERAREDVTRDAKAPKAAPKADKAARAKRP